MLIKVKDLQVGDEIIISSNSSLKYLKVLKEPQKNGKRWNSENYYKSVRCSVAGIKYNTNYQKHNGNAGIYTKTKYKFDTNIENHTLRINVDLNGKHIYLVKREKNEQL